MPSGLHDSSRTRVAPVFDLLQARSDDWVRHLLHLGDAAPETINQWRSLNLAFQKGFWGRIEHPMDPPVALLSWLIRNPPPALIADRSHPDRWLLGRGDPITIKRALHELRSSSATRGWYLLEGQTVPDVMIETSDALIVIEGKRTESGPTVDTTWLSGRHQIWRHIDAAWEIRGQRRVFGLFIVDGEESHGALPVLWREACAAARSEAVLASSFPHRSSAERAAIAECFIGATTWQTVCHAFAIDHAKLPRTIHELTAVGVGE